LSTASIQLRRRRRWSRRVAWRNPRKKSQRQRASSLRIAIVLVFKDASNTAAAAASNTANQRATGEPGRAGASRGEPGRASQGLEANANAHKPPSSMAIARRRRQPCTQQCCDVTAWQPGTYVPGHWGGWLVAAAGVRGLRLWSCFVRSSGPACLRVLSFPFLSFPFLSFSARWLTTRKGRVCLRTRTADGEGRQI
jgi:hypothetical protein